jgi:hypothetical protein
MRYLRGAEDYWSYIPELYLKSDYKYDPSTCKHLERRITTFRVSVRQRLLLLRCWCQQRPILNILPLTFNLIKHPNNNNIFTVVYEYKSMNKHPVFSKGLQSILKTFATCIKNWVGNRLSVSNVDYTSSFKLDIYLQIKSLWIYVCISMVNFTFLLTHSSST